MTATKQNVIIIAALTCSGKSTVARVPSDGDLDLDTTTTTTTNMTSSSQHQQPQQQQQYRTYTGPTVGEFLNKPGKKPLYVQNETKVRLLQGYEIFDLDSAPYRLERGSATTHDFVRYRADILKLNASVTPSSPPPTLANNTGGDGVVGRVILVSTHDATRDFLCREAGGWAYWLVHPAKSLRQTWVQRLRDRDARHPDRVKMDSLARSLDERFERIVEGIVRGLPMENGGTTVTTTIEEGGGSGGGGGGEGRPSFVATGGCIEPVSHKGGEKGTSSSNVQWVEIQDANMGLQDVVPFILAQQEEKQA